MQPAWRPRSPLLNRLLTSQFNSVLSLKGGPFNQAPAQVVIPRVEMALAAPHLYSAFQMRMTR
jgi:hypothetical protein